VVFFQAQVYEQALPQVVEKKHCSTRQRIQLSR
jgi:hypothetical protein